MLFTIAIISHRPLCDTNSTRRLGSWFCSHLQVFGYHGTGRGRVHFAVSVAAVAKKHGKTEHLSLRSN